MKEFRGGQIKITLKECVTVSSRAALFPSIWKSIGEGMLVPQGQRPGWFHGSSDYYQSSDIDKLRDLHVAGWSSARLLARLGLYSGD